MEQEYTTITKEFIKKASPKECGTLSKYQLTYLGMCLHRGWGKKLVDSKIKKEDVEYLFRLKYMDIRKLKKLKITPVKIILINVPIKRNKKAKVKTNGFKSVINFVLVNYEIEYKKQYYHPNWQRMRLFILDRDNFKCRECGDEHSVLHVHHKHYSSGFIWEIDPKALITLCDKCHGKAHKK